MRIFFSLCAFLCAFSSIYAQNTILLEQKEAEFSTDFNKLCNKALAEIGDMNRLIKYVFSAFSKEHLQRSSYMEKPTIEIDVPLYDGIIDWAYIDSLQHRFFKDAKQVKAIYKAAIPVFQAQFAQMTPSERTAYLAFIQEGIDYTSSFDLKKEQAELEQIHKEGWGFHHKKGTLKAFIYRRIVNKEISQKDCLYWLKKIYKDLPAKAPKSSSEVDAYNLSPIHGTKFFALGRIYGEPDSYIFEKKDDKWGLLKIDNQTPKVQKTSYYYNITHATGGLWVVFESKAGDTKLFFLRSDRAPLNLNATIDAKNFDLSRSVVFGEDGVKMSDGTVYAINKAGELEQNNIPENIHNISICFFQFKSGEKKLIAHKLLPFDLSPIKAPKIFVYGNYYNDFWVLDADNSLYHYWNVKTPETLRLPEPVKSIEKMGNRNIIIHYESGKSEVFLMEGKLADAKRIALSGTVAKCTELSPAWKTKAGVQLYRFKVEGDLYGMMDENGKIILAPNYAAFNPYYGSGTDKSYILLINKNKDLKYEIATEEGKDLKYGIATEEGKILLEPTFASLSVFELDAINIYFLFSAAENNLYGLIDDKGRILLPPNYRSIQKISSPTDKMPYLLLENSQKKKGLMDLQFREVMPLQYSYLSPIIWDEKTETTLFLFSESAEENSSEYLKGLKGTANFGIIDQKGKIIQKPIFYNVEQLILDDEIGSYPLFFVSKDLGGNNIKIALYSNTFKQLTDFIFSPVPAIDNIATYDPETFQEFIQKVAYDCPYIQLSGIQELMTMLQNGKQALYDFNGKELIPALWDSIAINSNPNNFKVLKSKKYGIVNRSGKNILPTVFDDIYTMDNIPLYFVGKKTEDNSIKYALHDMEGKAITAHIFNTSSELEILYDPDTFEEIEREKETRPGEQANELNRTMILQVGEKQALYNFEGKELIEPNTSIVLLSANIETFLYKVEADGLFALFDSAGKQLTKFIYDEFTIINRGIEAIDSATKRKLILNFNGEEE